MKKGFLILILIGVSSGFLFSHKNKPHDNQMKMEKMDEGKLNKIGVAYKNSIEPIFKNKCFSCHSANQPLPWYSKIPGPKQIIRDDITEAKEHFDMTGGFPFKGHSDPKSDLISIKESVESNTMPPFRYKMIHWKSGLSKDEKTTIIEWIEKSLIDLGEGSHE